MSHGVGKKEKLNCAAQICFLSDVEQNRWSFCEILDNFLSAGPE